MKTLILVGGASASGKSSLVKQLNKDIKDSVSYRRVQAFFDVANLMGFSRDETFKYVSSIDADNYFLEVCNNNGCVISDIHYALQMGRNFKLDNTDVNIFQEYVPTISKTLINNLLMIDVRVIAVHLTCSNEILYKRAIERNRNGMRELRAVSLEDVILQSDAERLEWMCVASQPLIYSIELNSEQYLPEELSKQVIDFMEQIKVSSFSRKLSD